jgi:DNA replication protein DnaC
MHEPWLPRVLEIEDTERANRSLKRRLDNARLGAFKPIADFDWAWPSKCDRSLIEELFSLAFVAEAANVVLIGANGLGKTMLLKNLTHQAVLKGCTARFTLASDMLHDLAAQDSSTALARRLRRYTSLAILAVDEVGYLSYDARYADLLFEVVTRRYQTRPILLTTNKVFGEWNQVFPNAACVVTLIDRLCTSRDRRARGRATASRKPRSAPHARPARAPRAGARGANRAAAQRLAAGVPAHRALRRGGRQPCAVPVRTHRSDRAPLLRTPAAPLQRL